MDEPIVDVAKSPAREMDPEKVSTSDTQEKPGIGPAPDGGLRAWLIVGGTTAIIFSTFGFANSYGTIQEYYQTHQLANESPSKISWIGSLSLFLQFFGGMFGGPFFDRYGEKSLYAPAALYVISLMLLSLCYEYWHFMLCQGVLMGLSMGLVQFPAYAAVLHYFDKKRAAALGIAVSGSSIGGVIMPLALSKMLNDSTLGFGWSIRVIGFLVLPLMLFACIVIKGRFPPRDSRFWLLSALTEKKYMLLVAAMFFLLLGTFTPFFYLPTYAVSRGMTPTLAGYLPAVINAASTFGRIGLGIAADKIGRLNVLAGGGLVTAILIFCMNSTVSEASFWVYAAFFGFASGTVISAGSAALSTCALDPRDVGTYIGMGMAMAGVGSLVGPPVNGAMVSEYGGYFQVSMFSGAVCLFGGFVVIAAKWVTPQGLLGKV